MDGELKYIHVVWIPAIPAGMTGFEGLVYKDERWSVGTREELLIFRVPYRIDCLHNPVGFGQGNDDFLVMPYILKI